MSKANQIDSLSICCSAPIKLLQKRLLGPMPFCTACGKYTTSSSPCQKKTKLKRKYIDFIRIPNPSKKTKRWEIHNRKGEILGSISWYSPWRQYCIVLDAYNIFGDTIIFSAGCLGYIEDFLEQINKEHKNKK